MAILRGDLSPGQALVERDLAATLGVSKTPVREALKILAATDLVHIVPFQGTAVRIVGPNEARAVYETRLLLEPEAVRRAASADSAQHNLERAAAALSDAHLAGQQGDYASLSMINRRFHRDLYAQCGNDVLCSFLDTLQDRVAFLSVQGWRRRTTWEHEAEQHSSILEAAQAGRADAAAARTHQHIAESLERLLEAFNSDLSPENHH